MPTDLMPGNWPVKIRPSRSVAENVTRMLRREYDRMLRFEEGARSGVDPEDLHRMRVSVRRMRTATRLFRPMLDRSAIRDLRQELRWLGGVLGQVRDRDTAIETLKHYEQEAPPEDLDWIRSLINETESSRVGHRQRLIEALDSDRFAQFREATEKLLSEGLLPKPGGEDRKLCQAVPGLIRKAWKAVHRAGEDAVDQGTEHLHRLRLDCKNLRYLCEFTRPVFKSRFDFLIGAVTRIQETLGQTRDLDRDMKFFATSENENPAGEHLHGYFAARREEALAKFVGIWKRMMTDEFRLWVRYHLRCLER